MAAFHTKHSDTEVGWSCWGHGQPSNWNLSWSLTVSLNPSYLWMLPLLSTSFRQCPLARFSHWHLSNSELWNWSTLPVLLFLKIMLLRCSFNRPGFCTNRWDKYGKENNWLVLFVAFCFGGGGVDYSTTFYGSSLPMSVSTYITSFLPFICVQDWPHVAAQHYAAKDNVGNTDLAFLQSWLYLLDQPGPSTSSELVGNRQPTQEGQQTSQESVIPSGTAGKENFYFHGGSWSWGYWK